MKCTKCSEDGVYKRQDQILCKNHFLDYFETKVLKTIRKNKFFDRNDKVCVAASGGKDSLAVLYLVMKYCKKNSIEFFALAIDEGIKTYRDKTLEDLREFCSKYDINLVVKSFKEKLGLPLDDIREKAMKELNKKPCTVCGIFRRTYLNREARELGSTKLVTGHNLDDESQTFLMNTLLGNMRHSAALGPVTGISVNKKFVPRVKPLYFVTEKETRLYTFIKGFKVEFNECPNIKLSYRAVVRDQLNNIEEKFPGAKNGIVNSFLEILPELKNRYKNDKPFSYCIRCGDPCSGNICNACTLEKQLTLIRT